MNTLLTTVAGLTSTMRHARFSEDSFPLASRVDGDVTDRVNLTPVAIAEARAFADTEFGNDPKRVDHRVVPSAVFTDPPIGTVGLSEAQAALRGPVDIYAADFRPMKTAFVGGTARTFMKLVVDGLDQRVLGVQMIGPEAPEIVQCLAVAVTCGARKRDFDQTIAMHPTLAEEFMLMRSPVRRVAQSVQAPNQVGAACESVNETGRCTAAVPALRNARGSCRFNLPLTFAAA